MNVYIKKFWPLYIFTVTLSLSAVLLASRAVTTLAQSAPIRRNSIIILDAGHGGEDGGAVSCSGVAESRLNLQITLRLNDLLHLLGYETKLIRTDDVSVYTEGTTVAAKKASDLRNRVKTVNETENGLLVSIHQNLFADSRYSGAQVFYNSRADAQGLAKAMQNAFVSTVNPGSNRQCKRASGIYLMEHIQKPGILVECGFLSNPEEDAKLRTEAYQQQICMVIAATLADYFSGA